MTALRRKAKPTGNMPALAESSVCDICSKGRGHGNHSKCSKQRQAYYAALRSK